MVRAFSSGGSFAIFPGIRSLLWNRALGSGLLTGRLLLIFELVAPYPVRLFALHNGDALTER
jgi:hypothetical protein